MIPDISLFWQGPEQVSWLWQGDTETQHGDWDALVDEKQQRNQRDLNARVYFPHHWFTSLSVTVPGNARRVPEGVLRFAAEELLAQDIDSLHMISLSRAEGGQVPVLVLDQERLSLVRATLAEANMLMVQAFDAGWFQVPADAEADLIVDCDEQSLLCRSSWVLHQVHASGFSQWYDFWRSTQATKVQDQPLKVKLVSRDANGTTRQLKTVLETQGEEVEWQVTAHSTLDDWNNICRQTRAAGNLMTGPFSIRKHRSNLGLWFPGAMAAGLALMIWSAVTWTETRRMEQQTEATWRASEQVFRQIFGPEKRIQRPLMVREVDNALIAQNLSQDGTYVSVLEALMALSNSHVDGLILEDFRYQLNRQEMLFTLKQAPDKEGDAFARFEQTKVRLESVGYDVEYSASAERDSARGRYRALKGGAS